MKTNSKEVKENVRSFIMGAIDFTDYPEYQNTALDAWTAYQNQAYHAQRNSMFENFKNYMQGLPSWFNLPYYDQDIVDTLISWGLPATDQNGKDFPVDKSIDLFYWLIFRELKGMANSQNKQLLDHFSNS